MRCSQKGSSLLMNRSSPENRSLSPNSPPKAVRDPRFAGTVVTKGFGMALVHSTGLSTEMGKIGQSLALTDCLPSRLQLSSRTLIRNLTLGAFALALLLVSLNWLINRHPFLESFLSGITLAMAILPEEIPVILTVFLALGAWRITRINVLTRRVSAVEALGAIDVLAVDKTGTLTQNRMEVAELAVEDAYFDAAEESDVPESFHALVEFALLATPADPFDPMEKAIRSFAQTRLMGTEHLHGNPTPIFQYELSPEIMAMTQIFSDIHPSLHLLATKGSPEAIMDLCHLPQSECRAIRQMVESMAGRGLRVLGVARGEWAPESKDSPVWPACQHDFDFTFLGLVGFADPLRPDVPAAIAQCRSAGIRVVMLTGDHPATAQTIAHQAGFSEASNILTGDEISLLDDEALSQRLKESDICARIKPEQKLRLVRMLQHNAHVVAMTGDGVNDAPALKAADIGIAMGERGTDVARESAALVLLDDSFASIVSAITQGRRIYDNITKAARFVFAVHLPIILLTLFPALMHWPVLLQPVHIVLLQLLIDPACAIVFEAEPAAAGIMNRPPRSRRSSPFTADNILWGLAQGFGIAVILLIGYIALLDAGWSASDIRMSLFVALVPSLFLLVVTNRDLPLALRGSALPNPWIGWMFGGVGLILSAVLLIPPLRGMLGFPSLTLAPLIASLLLVFAAGAWLRALHWLNRNYFHRG